MKLFFLTTMTISVLAVNAQIELLFSILETSACAALCYDDSCHTITSAACFCSQSTVISGCVHTDCGADILALVLRAGHGLCGNFSCHLELICKETELQLYQPAIQQLVPCSLPVRFRQGCQGIRHSRLVHLGTALFTQSQSIAPPLQLRHRQQFNSPETKHR